MPRRARHLFPTELPRRGEAMAACALAIALAHLLTAQLTLALAITFTLIGRATRWRPWWLLGPAAAGLLWTLAVGPAQAAAGFAAGPARILGYFGGWGAAGGGPLAGRLDHPLAAFGGAGTWLPAQAPLALLVAAAEVAAVCWLDWLHTDEWAVKPARPGPVAALRRTLTIRMIRRGGVVTAEGCALGVLPVTGATAELHWTEIADGALVVGADAREVTLTCLQVVHAALRRRKPLIVLDGGGDPGIPAALAAACAATGTPLWRGTVRGPDGDLDVVMRERCAALLPTGTAELAAKACDQLAAAGAQLRRIGVPGDVLVWVPQGEQLPVHALATMIRAGAAIDMPVLVGSASAQAAGELAGLVGTVLIHRVADPNLAARLAAHTGTWLLPATAALHTSGGGAVSSVGSVGGGETGIPSVGAPLGHGMDAQAGLVPTSRVAPRILLSLAPAEFVLTVRGPQPRLVTGGRVVLARLPQPVRAPGERRVP